MNQETDPTERPAGAAQFSRRDLDAIALFLTGLAIQLFGNSPAAAGGAFIAAGLCVVAEAIARRP